MALAKESPSCVDALLFTPSISFGALVNVPTDGFINCLEARVTGALKSAFEVVTYAIDARLCPALVLIFARHGLSVQSEPLVTTALVAPFKVDAVPMYGAHMGAAVVALVNVLTDAACELVTSGAKTLVAPFYIHAFSQSARVHVSICALVIVHTHVVDLVVAWITYTRIARRLIDTVPIDARISQPTFVYISAGVVARHDEPMVALALKSAH